jgi:hypothetical protein
MPPLLKLWLNAARAFDGILMPLFLCMGMSVLSFFVSLVARIVWPRKPLLSARVVLVTVAVLWGTVACLVTDSVWSLTLGLEIDPSWDAARRYLRPLLVAWAQMTVVTVAANACLTAALLTAIKPERRE